MRQHGPLAYSPAQKRTQKNNGTGSLHRPTYIDYNQHFSKGRALYFLPGCVCGFLIGRLRTFITWSQVQNEATTGTLENPNAYPLALPAKFLGPKQIIDGSLTLIPWASSCKPGCK